MSSGDQCVHPFGMVETNQNLNHDGVGNIIQIITEFVCTDCNQVVGGHTTAPGVEHNWWDGNPNTLEKAIRKIAKEEINNYARRGTTAVIIDG